MQIARVAAQVGMAVLLARLLGPKGYGEYAFALVIVLLLQAPVRFGMTNLAVRFTSVYRDSGMWPLLLGLRRSLLFWALGYVSLVALGFIVLTFFYGDHLGEAASRPVLLMAAGVLLLFPFLALFGGILRGLKLAVLGQLPEYVVYPALFLLCLSVASVSGHVFEAWEAMAVNAFVCLIVTLVAGFWVWKKMSAAVDSRKETEYASKQWLKAIIPLTLSGSLVVINNQAGVFFVGLLSGAPQAGIYRVGAQGASLVVLGLLAVGLLVAPEVARLYARREHRALQMYVTLGARIATVGALIVTFLYVMWGRQILATVFGPQFAVGYPVLVVLSVAQLVNAASGLDGTILNMCGYERDSMAGFLIAAVSNTIFNLVLTPRYGAIGAALSALLSMILWNGFLVVRTYRKTGLNCTVFRLAVTK